MTRLGASILLLILLAGGAFASLLTFGAGEAACASAGRGACEEQVGGVGPVPRQARDERGEGVSGSSVRSEPVEARQPGERLARGMCLDVARHERCGAGTLAVPVAHYPRAALTNTWGDPREEGARRHEGLDIIAPANTPVLAVAPGRVEKLFESGLGGTTLYQRSVDGRWIYYYAHLAAYAPGIREGARLRAGQPIARVGDTGDAGAGNYHLHFGVSRMRPGEHWWQGEAVNPYPLLARAPAAR